MPINLTMIETGTKAGYEDYHGEILDGSYKKIATWDFDKNQSMYISSIEREGNKPKRFYAPSVSQLQRKMENWLNNNNY